MTRISNPGESETDYEVFLNFRGSDSRQGLASTLRDCMLGAKIRVFFDDESMRAGEDIAEALERAIRSYNIYVTIFSENYASSKWCLKELALIESEWKSKCKQILPIFSDVTTADVKLKTDRYKVALEEHRKNVAAEEVQRWEDALKVVAGIKGRQVKDTSFVDFSKKFVDDVRFHLKRKSTSNQLVGVEDQVKDIEKLLDIASGDVRYLVIHGKSGSGKTSLAKIAFDRLSARFQGCSFLAEIRDSSEHNGISSLKNQLLCDIPHSTDERLKDITERFRFKKVLIVLDDVNQPEQIEYIAGSSTWFGPGSRIIITTRNRTDVLATEEETRILVQPREVLYYEMKDMMPKTAIRLFSRHAFGEDTPPESYKKLANDVVTNTGRLPLTLEIFGSFLHRKDQEDWRKTIKQLENIRLCNSEEIHEKLKIVFHALNDEAKQVVLDIACLFVNKEKTNAMYMWEACYDDIDKRIDDLTAMSLIKIVRNKFWMHDELRDLGRRIVREMSFGDLGKCSRLWIHDEALEVLKRKEGKQDVEALRLRQDYSLRCTLTDKEFASLKKLRFLQLCKGNFSGDLKDLLPVLRWLSWHGCPQNLDAANLLFLNLVILDLAKSYINCQWSGWSQLEVHCLKVLDLTNCKELTRTPDFSKYLDLERLILEGCENLLEIDPSISELKYLNYLNIKGCDSLEGLPEEVGLLEALTEILIMKGNGKSFYLPASVGNLKSLLVLEIVNVKLTLPDSIGRLNKLKRLSLFKCSGIEQLPNSVGDLESLVELDISETDISVIPDSIQKLKKLKVLKMEGSSIRELPAAIGMLEKLEEIHAKRCDGLVKIPETIGWLSHLRFLDLSGTSINELPETISNLYCLQILRLENYDECKRIPKLPQRLTSLQLKFQSLPDIGGLSELKNLVTLVIFDAGRYPPSTVPSSILNWTGELPKLENLELGVPNLASLPPKFAQFPSLKSLSLSCHDLRCWPQLPSSLSRLFLAHVKVKRKLTHFSNLKILSFLKLYKCSVRDDGSGTLDIGQLTSLAYFCAQKCQFSMVNGLRLPKDLTTLILLDCKFDVCNLLDLSGLQKVQQLELCCEGLKEIRGLGELKLLQGMDIYECHSLRRLDGLSNLRKLQSLEICDCDMLTDIEGLDKLTTLKKSRIICKNLRGQGKKLRPVEC